MNFRRFCSFESYITFLVSYGMILEDSFLIINFHQCCLAYLHPFLDTAGAYYFLVILYYVGILTKLLILISKGLNYYQSTQNYRNLIANNFCPDYFYFLNTASNFMFEHKISHYLAPFIFHELFFWLMLAHLILTHCLHKSLILLYLIKNTSNLASKFSLGINQPNSLLFILYLSIPPSIFCFCQKLLLIQKRVFNCGLTFMYH